MRATSSSASAGSSSRVLGACAYVVHRDNRGSGSESRYVRFAGERTSYAPASFVTRATTGQVVRLSERGIGKGR
jgi:hypothetical protein